MKICITGGICTGKSTLYDIFKYAFPDFNFLSVDEVVALFYTKDEIKRKLYNSFGTCDNKSISDMAFSGGPVLKLLHEMFDDAVFEHIEKKLSTNDNYIVEFPLYFNYEDRVKHLFDYVIKVNASLHTRFIRATCNRHMSPDKFWKILENQVDGEYIFAPNYLSITNNGSFDNDTWKEFAIKTKLIVNYLKRRM